MIGLWLCWGSSLPAMRVMVATLPPLLTSGAVFVTAGAVLAATGPGALRGVSFRQAATAAGAGTCLLGAQGTVALAERHVFASTAALLVAVVPLWVTVLRAALGDRPTRAATARLLLGLAGVAAVLTASPDGGDGWSPWALAVAAATIAWAAGTLWASRSAALPPPRAATVVQLSAGGLVLLAVGAVTGEPARLAPATVSAGSWLALSYLVLIDSLSGFALYNWLLRTAKVTLVSAYAYAVPIVAYLTGVLALGEPFRPAVLPGAAAIIAAVTAEARCSDRSRRAPQPIRGIPMRKPTDSVPPPRSAPMRFLIRPWEYRRPRLWVRVRITCGIFNVVLGVALLTSAHWLGPLALLAALPLAGAALIFWTARRLQVSAQR